VTFLFCAIKKALAGKNRRPVEIGVLLRAALARKHDNFNWDKLNYGHARSNLPGHLVIQQIFTFLETEIAFVSRELQAAAFSWPR
jgi:hypothetical protein